MELMADRRRIIHRALVVLGGVLVASTAAVIATQPLWAFDLLAWAMPRILWRVETKKPLVALSFDDGPAPDHTPQVLEILARHEAHATFFLIGDRRWPIRTSSVVSGGKGTRWATTTSDDTDRRSPGWRTAGSVVGRRF